MTLLFACFSNEMCSAGGHIKHDCSVLFFFFLPALIRTEGLIEWDNVTAYLVVSHGLVTKKTGVRQTL